MRTCVGCRRRAPRGDLLRVVAREGRLLPDPARREPGRGASLHPVPACLEAALRRRAFPRALRVSGPLDPGGLAAYVGGPGGADAPTVPGEPPAPASG